MAEGALKKIKLHESEERMFINHQRKLVYATSAQMKQEFKSRVFPLVYLILRIMARLPKDLVLHMLRYLHWDYVECPVWKYFLNAARSQHVMFLIRPASLIEPFVEMYSNFETGRWKFSSKKYHSNLTSFRFWVSDRFNCLFAFSSFNNERHLAGVEQHCKRAGYHAVCIDLRDFVAATAAAGGGGNSK